MCSDMIVICAEHTKQYPFLHRSTRPRSSAMKLGCNNERNEWNIVCLKIIFKIMVRQVCSYQPDDERRGNGTNSSSGRRRPEADISVTKQKNNNNKTRIVKTWHVDFLLFLYKWTYFLPIKKKKKKLERKLDARVNLETDAWKWPRYRRHAFCSQFLETRGIILHPLCPWACFLTKRTSALRVS